MIPAPAIRGKIGPTQLRDCAVVLSGEGRFPAVMAPERMLPESVTTNSAVRRFAGINRSMSMGRPQLGYIVADPEPSELMEQEPADPPSMTVSIPEILPAPSAVSRPS